MKDEVVELIKLRAGLAAGKENEEVVEFVKTTGKEEELCEDGRRQALQTTGKEKGLCEGRSRAALQITYGQA